MPVVWQPHSLQYFVDLVIAGTSLLEVAKLLDHQFSNCDNIVKVEAVARLTDQLCEKPPRLIILVPMQLVHAHKQITRQHLILYGVNRCQVWCGFRCVKSQVVAVVETYCSLPGCQLLICLEYHPLRPLAVTKRRLHHSLCCIHNRAPIPPVWDNTSDCAILEEYLYDFLKKNPRAAILYDNNAVELTFCFVAVPKVRRLYKACVDGSLQVNDFGCNGFSGVLISGADILGSLVPLALALLPTHLIDTSLPDIQTLFTGCSKLHTADAFRRYLTQTPDVQQQFLTGACVQRLLNALSGPRRFVRTVDEFIALSTEMAQSLKVPRDGESHRKKLTKIKRGNQAHFAKCDRCFRADYVGVLCLVRDHEPVAHGPPQRMHGSCRHRASLSGKRPRVSI